MSEDFVNSGWKEKKLWTPQEEEERARASQGAGTSKDPRARAVPSSRGIAGTLEAAGRGKELVAEAPAEARPEAKRAGEGPAGRTGSGGPAAAAEVAGSQELPKPPKPAKPPKPPRSPKGPLDALDPESSSSDESDSPALPPEYAVLDMNVPRTAMVINVSHVLKRLNGCCSLNQLTKSLKSFKDSTGVTLEQFLRANPTTFKLEGRIVFLVDRNGEKWKPPEAARAAGLADGAKGKGKRKGGKGEAAVRGGGGKDGGGTTSYGQKWSGSGRESHDSWWDGGWQAPEWNAGGGWSGGGGGWHEQSW